MVNNTKFRRIRRYFNNEENPEKSLADYILVRYCQKKILFILLILQLLIVWIIYENSNKFYDFSDSVNSHKHSIPMLKGKVFHLPLTSSKDMLPFYKDISQDVWCLNQGTNVEDSLSQKKCSCIDNWQGFDCGMPPSVWDSDFIAKGKAAGVILRRQERPRRIVCLQVFNSDFDLLEIQVQELFDIVDIFVIAEENSSLSSNVNLPLLSHLNSGFLYDFQKKIIHVPVLIPNRKYIANETLWLHIMYQMLLKETWKRVSDFRPDDILVISPTDAISSRDILLFMKLYSGYPEPVFLKLRPLIYNFRLLVNESHNSLAKFEPIMCSFQYFSNLCKYDILKLFKHSCVQTKASQEEFEKYFWKIKKWIAGSDTNPAGWNCQFCSSGQNIAEMLVHHPWLIKDISKKLFQDLLSNRTGVIDSYRKAEKWLDNSAIISKKLSMDHSFLAPQYLLKNIENFSDLIGNYLNKSL